MADPCRPVLGPRVVHSNGRDAREAGGGAPLKLSFHFGASNARGFVKKLCVFRKWEPGLYFKLIGPRGPPGGSLIARKLM
jgi:hypothetical protein